MRSHQWKKTGPVALLGAAALFLSSSWIGRRPYITPGMGRVFHQDSTAGAMAGFLVFVAAAIVGLVILLVGINDRNFREGARVGRICAAIFVVYMAALLLVSVVTPGKIVTRGDSYCWDLRCMGIERVNAVSTDGNTLYTAEVRVFTDSNKSHRVPAERARTFFYVTDDRGRRFPLLADSSFVNADVTLNPGQRLKSSLRFRAPADAGRLYLIAEDIGPPWVHLYLGSDLAPFHRQTRLWILQGSCDFSRVRELRSPRDRRQDRRRYEAPGCPTRPESRLHRQ